MTAAGIRAEVVSLDAVCVTSVVVVVGTVVVDVLLDSGDC